MVDDGDCGAVRTHDPDRARLERFRTLINALGTCVRWEFGPRSQLEWSRYHYKKSNRQEEEDYGERVLG